MKKGATFEENIKFLISMYERELENTKKEDYTIEEIEMIETYIDELKFILEISR